MEPPVKRRRLGEPLQSWDDNEEEEVEDDWEEYDGDDDTEAAPVQKRRGSVERDDGYQLAIEKAYADDRFRATMAHIFEKYGRDFEGIGDEIDLSTGEIVVNNGHIQNMRHEVDVGIPGEEADYESESEEVEDDEDGDLSDEDDVEEEEGEDSVLLKDSTDHEMAKSGSKTVDENDVQMEASVDNQPWATDTDDTDAMPDYMQLQGPYPDPDALDGIPGYNQGGAAEDGPSLISGLYDGGGLRYASSLGPYGSSPFALGPWEMLPQVQEGCDFPKPSGLSSAWVADYRYREQPSMPMHSNLASPRSCGNWPKSMASPEAYNSKDIEMEDSGNSANLFEQHPEEASALSAEGNQTAVSGEVRLGIQAKSPICHTRTPHIASVKDSDTVEDPVFSAGDLEASSQTGDDAPVSNQAHKPEASNRVIPDSQDTCPSQEDDAVPPTAPTGARASYNKPSHQNFDLACMLSDDETPLFTLPPGVTINNHQKKVVGSVANPASVGISGISSDDAAVKRGRGRPRKYPRPDGHGQQSDSSLPKKHKSRFKVPAPNASATRIDPVSRNSSIPAQPTYFVPHISRIPTFAAADQSEAESGTKRKRGRPRKSETTQQQAQQPFMHYPAQMFGQPYFFPPFQFGFQPQSFHHPFQTTMQQPFQAFQTFPPQMAYQPLQTSFPQQQPLVQLQQQMIQPPIQQLLQQPPPQPPPQPRPVPTGETPQQEEPVKRKRGRPRKYPVGYKRVRRKVQIPGLQNSMTALLSGHPNRTPVTEDAWYGVARRLAHDISSLQGGYFLSNGFQMQTQTYEPGTERPCLSPKNQFDDPPSESASEGELEPHDTGRITELLDNANDAMSSKPPSGDTHQADGSETFEDSECSEDSESPGLTANDDDAGFVIMESPKSVAQSVEPTPSPPSPPMSTRRSSPSTREKHSATTPTPVRNIGSRTPTPIQALKSRTPVSHNSDAFDLPSSPMSRHIRTGLSSKASIVEAAYTEPTDFEEELILPVEDDVSDFARDGEAPPVDSADMQSLLPNETLADSPTEPVAFMDVSSVTTPSTPKSKKASSATFTPQGLLKTRSPTPLTDPDEIFAPSQPGMDGIPSPSARTPTASPSLFVSSPVQTAPRTPDQPRSKLAATVTRQSPLPRAAMVPRSAERCTPIFLDVKRLPPKWPNMTEKRTMGELKQAIIAPKTKAHDSRSQGPKQMSLKLMLGQVIPDKPIERKEDIRPSSPTAEAKRYSSLKVPGKKVSTTSKTSRQLVPEADMTKDKKRHRSRRSLLSLVSGSAKGQEDDDDEDELGSPVQSKSSSSSKPPRSFIASKVGVHSTRKIWKSTPRTTEDPVRPERERAKERKSKKKRRHTEGSVSKRSGPATSDGNNNGQECGVDGYTCNRDFCFTCL
ncbi:hypothetical protein EsDP_00000355 [Epichloe bromicola]|uniref:Myb-like DNA-binding domain protein n=1 Tax=Epichloe bromicola TaxID=79588 RepID=A0ABQ0CEN9_9HYPO